MSAGAGGTPPADQSLAAGAVWRGHLAPPPPSAGSRPRARYFEPGDRLVRIYDPTSHGARELTFRSYGPTLRFDHHPPGSNDSATVHAGFGIWYGSWGPEGIRSCGVEAFGDRRIRLRPGRLAVPVATRRLVLLDLCGDGGMLAGASAELPKWADMRMTWAWARHFHGLAIDGQPVDGITWDSARSNLPCLALFERAADGIACPLSGTGSLPLAQRDVHDQLLTLVRDFGFTLAP